MVIIKVVPNEAKRHYLDLLLLADEQVQMVERYLETGHMFVLEDDGVKGECVVMDMGQGVLEIKNIAITPTSQRRGYGKLLIAYIEQHYKGAYHTLQVGTGDSPLTIPFYEQCGFVRHHRIKDFFLTHYDHPIIEAGVQLIDMVYLIKRL